MPRILEDGTVLMETPPTRDGVDEFGREISAPGIIDKSDVVPHPNPDAEASLNEVRDFIGLPIVRHSAFRPATHPLEAVKAKPGTGPHTQDDAHDVSIPGLTMFETVLAFEQHPEYREGGRGIYLDRHTMHVDKGRKRDWAVDQDGNSITYEDALKQLPGYDPAVLKAARSGKIPAGYAPYMGPPDALGNDAAEESHAHDEQTNAAFDMMGLSPKAQVFIEENSEKLGRFLSYPGNRFRAELVRYFSHGRGEKYADFPDELSGPDFLNIISRELEIKGPDGEYIDWNKSASNISEFKWDETRDFNDQAGELADMMAQEMAKMAIVVGTEIATDPIFGALSALGTVYKTGKGLAAVTFSALQRYTLAWGAAKDAGVITKGMSPATKMSKVQEFMTETKTTGSWDPAWSARFDELVKGVQAKYAERLKEAKKVRTFEEIDAAATELNVASGGTYAKDMLHAGKSQEVLNNVEIRLLEDLVEDIGEDLGKAAEKFLRTTKHEDATALLNMFAEQEFYLAKFDAIKSNMGAATEQLDRIKKLLTERRMESLSDIYKSGELDLAQIAIWMTQKCRR